MYKTLTTYGTIRVYDPWRSDILGGGGGCTKRPHARLIRVAPVHPMVLSEGGGGICKTPNTDQPASTVKLVNFALLE